ncbi:MAG: peptide chain release factor N(5)-glutamine methyltransferase [Muribaculaceae bacterium]
MTLEECNKLLTSKLTAALDAGEARSTVRLLLEDVAFASPVDVMCHGERPLEPETVELLLSMADRIAAGEPPQYVVGRARFCGVYLRVTPATLIPRPETEGLVDIITDRHRGGRDLRVLDIGTGSGCIAIALSRALPFARVDACDISSEALGVARDNARQLRAAVDFFRTDILREPLPDSPLYDVIVSNPPYIARSEAAEMEPRVLQYEPHTALFVDDADPLLFYRAIARYARAALRPGGSLYFEINPLFAKQLEQMLHAEGFTRVEVQRDYCGRQRFAIAQR